MPRSYDARLAALTIGAPFKWIDNLLSQHALPGISRGRQGVARRISDEGLLAICVTRLLSLELGMSVQQAAHIARAAVPSRSGAELRFTTPAGVTVSIPTPEIEARLRQGLVSAVEAVAARKRGRPPRSEAPL